MKVGCSKSNKYYVKNVKKSNKKQNLFFMNNTNISNTRTDNMNQNIRQIDYYLDMLDTANALLLKIDEKYIKDVVELIKVLDVCLSRCYQKDGN